MHLNQKVIFLPLIFLNFVLACAPQESFRVPLQKVSGKASAEVSPTPEVSDHIPFCSRLDFTGITWPAAIPNGGELDAFKLVLSIAGTFEGNDTWANLANDSDGAGMSLGLLQQTLATGSLEPLLIEMRAKHRGDLERYFSRAHLLSLNSMLDQWLGTNLFFEESFNEEVLSIYDLPSQEAMLTQTLTRSQAAALWARNNIYDSRGRFKEGWALEFQTLARDQNYKTLQVGAAVGYHQKALAYQQTIGVKELRAYLMAFDFVTQNGGFYAENITEYRAWLSANPRSNSDQRLNKILEIRLKRVKPQYYQDVKSRKLTFITGQGTVHGAFRKLQTEFCYNGLTVFPGTIITPPH